MPPALAALILLTVAGTASPARDMLSLGDPASENNHAFAGEKSQAGEGGLGERCRRIEPGGELAFELACDPTRTNYLTLKLWGSDREVCTLFLAGERNRYGRYGEEVPELDLNQGGAAFPGRFYYATYRIPAELTAHRRKVRLRLLAVGGIAPYAPRDRVEQPLKRPTRGIYRVYLGTDPFFVPAADERQGTSPRRVAPVPSPVAGLAEANLRHLDAAVDDLLRWQLYGPDWDARVAKKQAPAALTGAVVRGGAPRSAPSAWQDWVTARSTDANCSALAAVGVYARAYHLAGSKYHGDRRLLERVLKALDFHAIAQGSNGGFSARHWVGGPKRARAGGIIEGDGTRWLGRALLHVYRELQQQGLLDARIDDDDDPATPAVSRRAAYARLFALHRDFLGSREGQGHAANQDMLQVLALWTANESVRLLAPDRAWPRDRALAPVRRAAGLAPDLLGGQWLSRKGLPLEPWGTLGGGYCGNYGLLCVHLLSELAELSGDEAVRRRASEAFRAASHFYYPDTDEQGQPVVRKEGVISTRNTKWPCQVDYGLDPYAAVELGCAEARRAFQLWLADGHRPAPLDRGAHFPATAARQIHAAGHFARALTLPTTPTRLFNEPGQADLARADESGSVIAARHGDARLYVSLNWRRGFRRGGRDPDHVRVNNIARIHHTTPAVDRIVTLEMQSPHGFGKLYLCTYGPYRIALNLTDDTTYSVPPLPDVAEAIDLISGKKVDVRRSIALPPSSSLVLVKQGPASR